MPSSRWFSHRPLRNAGDEQARIIGPAHVQNVAAAVAGCVLAIGRRRDDPVGGDDQRERLARQEERAARVDLEERTEDLAQPGTRERDPSVERLSAQPLRDVEDSEAHMTALVAGDELDDPAQQRVRGVIAERFEECALAKRELMPGWPVLRMFNRSRVRIASAS